MKNKINFQFYELTGFDIPDLKHRSIDASSVCKALSMKIEFKNMNLFFLP